MNMNVYNLVAKSEVAESLFFKTESLKNNRLNLYRYWNKVDIDMLMEKYLQDLWLVETQSRQESIYSNIFVHKITYISICDFKYTYI